MCPTLLSKTGKHYAQGPVQQFEINEFLRHTIEAGHKSNTPETFEHTCTGTEINGDAFNVSKAISSLSSHRVPEPSSEDAGLPKEGQASPCRFETQEACLPQKSMHNQNISPIPLEQEDLIEGTPVSSYQLTEKKPVLVLRQKSSPAPPTSTGFLSHLRQEPEIVKRLVNTGLVDSEAIEQIERVRRQQEFKADLERQIAEKQIARREEAERERKWQEEQERQLELERNKLRRDYKAEQAAFRAKLAASEIPNTTERKGNKSSSFMQRAAPVIPAAQADLLRSETAKQPGPNADATASRRGNRKKTVPGTRITRQKGSFETPNGGSTMPTTSIQACHVEAIPGVKPGTTTTPSSGAPQATAAVEEGTPSIDTYQRTTDPPPCLPPPNSQSVLTQASSEWERRCQDVLHMLIDIVQRWQPTNNAVRHVDPGLPNRHIPAVTHPVGFSRNPECSLLSRDYPYHVLGSSIGTTYHRHATECSSSIPIVYTAGELKAEDSRPPSRHITLYPKSTSIPTPAATRTPGALALESRGGAKELPSLSSTSTVALGQRYEINHASQDHLGERNSALTPSIATPSHNTGNDSKLSRWAGWRKATTTWKGLGVVRRAKTDEGAWVQEDSIL